MNNKNSCPSGYILRKGYTRRFRKSIANSGYTVRRKGTVYVAKPKIRSITVKPGCIRDRGLPGKGPRNGEGIGKLRKGDLIKYGYQYRLSDLAREKALRKAIHAYGAESVYHKLDAVAKLSLRTSPDASLIFTRDRNWVKDNFMKN
jgi:hypothetical protein